MRENIGRSKKLFHKNFPFHFLLSPANPWSLPGCSRRGLAVKTRNDRQKNPGQFLLLSFPAPTNPDPNRIHPPQSRRSQHSPEGRDNWQLLRGISLLFLSSPRPAGVFSPGCKIPEGFFFFFAGSAPGDTRNPRRGWVGRDSKVLGQEAPVSVRKGSSKRASGSFPDPSPAPFSSES